jgi:AcrR family transcriptional regulator
MQVAGASVPSVTGTHAPPRAGSAAAAGSPAQRARPRRIQDTTVALAANGGFEAVQMRAVAERAEVALGTLYRYFPSKIHLLVAVLAAELEAGAEAVTRRPVPGDTAAERVTSVLDKATESLQREPALAEAMIRAFMFADATAAEESRMVALHVGAMLTRAMRGGGHPDGAAVSEADSNEKDEAGLEQERAIVKVLSDVWLSSLVQWVTGRASAADVTSSLQTAVRLVLR